MTSESLRLEGQTGPKTPPRADGVTHERSTLQPDDDVYEKLDKALDNALGEYTKDFACCRVGAVVRMNVFNLLIIIFF